MTPRGETGTGRAAAGSRRAALAKARQSRRPSRLGERAGAAPKPDFVFDSNAGFPGLLARTWSRAAAEQDPGRAVELLLTLGGLVPADISLRALRCTEEAALRVLFGISWREPADKGRDMATADAAGPPAFLGELGLTTSGRVVLSVPSEGPLAGREKLVDGVLRIPWPAPALTAYEHEVGQASARSAAEAADCRAWLSATGPQGRDRLLDELKDAARRTAPFVLYQEERQYTNFRERNTLPGKTLWPGHPDCALSALQGIPLALWSDSDVVMVVCLALLVRSAGYARIEEANGTQLTVGHVAALLERTRRKYNAVPGGRRVRPAASQRVTELRTLAAAIRARRAQVTRSVQLYREIHGPLMHKIERVAEAPADGAREREQRICARLADRIPVTGGTLAEMSADIQAGADWLTRPHGAFGTGLESLVYETVSAARAAFDADFAMSRGLRSLPALIQALRHEDWARISGWELPEYFCCVVPAAGARRYFEDSADRLADVAWAISSRMQYNSWHFIVGNLPKVPEVEARDYFVPPTVPDIAFHSDQHHHGHVAAQVRFSIRSPQAVKVLDRAFGGFVDLRLLRCAGTPFGEQDLLAAQHVSTLLADATTATATLVAAGAEAEVTAFGPQWHWETVTAGESRCADG
ncbi:hypothetical protein [Streptomyces sp. MZ04]|uniref:hypothetical protein n=1 Tax=Streptomyces sp. MZ04 TaxID=2559236 RepID=UPI00107E659B|nr:hypothetical protein [Streptomyces sp. MZ04]TGB15112.1 hypothetical protein E2651_03550 [Streptomyces sp. MZ04]